MDEHEFIIMIIAWIVGTGSLGSATLAICGTAMQYGRKAALQISSGVLATGLLFCAAGIQLLISTIET